MSEDSELNDKLEALKASIKAKRKSSYYDSILTPEGYVSKAPKRSKPQGMVPLTKEEWDALNPKAQWDSIVALRGPDLKNSDTLKWFTSSVIRYRLSNAMRVGGLVNSSLPYVVLPKDYPQEKEFSISHFTGHIYEAANWLSIPTVNVPGDVYKQLLQNQVNRYKGAVLLAPYLVSPEAKAATKAFAEGGGYDWPVEKEGPNAASGAL